jgi:hypothetical protein
MTAGLHRNRLHYALVVGETSLGFALLIGSSLLIKTLYPVVAGLAVGQVSPSQGTQIQQIFLPAPFTR